MEKGENLAQPILQLFSFTRFSFNIMYHNLSFI